MRQTEGINQTRKGKHLKWEERIQIKTLQREGFSSQDIGKRLGRPSRTIRREILRGWVTHRISKYCAEERYRADRGQTMEMNSSIVKLLRRLYSEESARISTMHIPTLPGSEEVMRTPTESSGVLFPRGAIYRNSQKRKFRP